jgi:hypothetical protein
MSIFDPFAGYGTVGVVSRLYGNDYELWDLNPMLEVLHKISIMSPPRISMNRLREELTSNKNEFFPDWGRIQYWYPPQFIPFLIRIWGYYHSLSEGDIKMILTIPLLKVSRYFSFDDAQRQKLSKSSRSQKKIEDLLKSDWPKIFYKLLESEVKRVVRGIEEYQGLFPCDVKFNILAGVDSLKQELEEEKDILITSPPYLQSQEYIRQAKLDLFWLGYKEEYIKDLGKLEIPYRSIDHIDIYSKTYQQYMEQITEDHIKKVFQRYFWGVLGAVTRLQQKIKQYLFLFVGHASSRGISIPIDKIFVEHFSQLGWEYEVTLVDKIVSRRLFNYKINPATGKVDARTKVENLVVLKRR